MKNKGLLIGLGVLVLIFFWGCGKYNGIVTKDETVKNAWADVQVQYQRRADLIPGLIKTVQEAAKNEKDILTAVTNARAGIVEGKNDIKNATTIEQLEAGNRKINSALTIAVEAYPQIRSTEAFLKFQDDLTGTENRISTARSDYNKAVKDFNVSIRTFPGNMVAGIAGFKMKAEFKAKEGAENSPDYDNLWDKDKK